jgi:hypothetical protein
MKQLKPDLESHRVVVLNLVQILSSIGGRSGEPNHLEAVELPHDLLRHFEFVYAAKVIRAAVFRAKNNPLKDDREIEIGSDIVALA